MLISQNLGHEWDPDAESIAGVFEVEVQDVPVESVPELPVHGRDRVHGVQHASATLDIVNVAKVFFCPVSTCDAVSPLGHPRCFQDSSQGGNARDSCRH